MLTEKQGIVPNRGDVPEAKINRRFFRWRWPIAWLQPVDVALTLAILLFLFTQHKIFQYHLIFLILTYGAFHWQFRAFVLRMAVALAVVTTVLALLLFSGGVPPEEISEIPLMTAILVLVYTIARQRSRAQEQLQMVNEELEHRVSERTADLMAEIAERRQAEQTLRASEDRYRRLVELSFEAVIIHSHDKVIYVNPAAVKLFGAPDAPTLIGRSIFEIVHPDSLEATRSRLARAQHAAYGVPLAEEKFMCLDGTSVDVEIVTIPITYQGRPALQTVLRDIRVRKLAEQARIAERTSIARDLHDSLGQSLGYLQLKLNQIVDDTDSIEASNVRDELTGMRDMANEAYEQVRDMLASFMPVNTIPIAKALRDLALAVGTRARFKAQVVERGQGEALSPVLQQQLLYLCSEALNNIAKHADATQVKIELHWEADSLTVNIKDDGRGFDPSAPLAQSSYGLRIMRERIAQVKGEFTINSDPGSGTELIFRVPLHRIAKV
jgi:PAS domain S-box-containing protein